MRMIKAVIFDMFETLVTLFNCPLYKGAQIAADMDLPEAEFRKIWDRSDDARTLGDTYFEAVIREIMEANDIFDPDLLDDIVRRRYDFSAEVFRHKHPDIIPMLRSLRDNGLKTALITNCYFEEKEAIINSDLNDKFDVICMSCVLKIKKPAPKIFEICSEKLGVTPAECLYVGDGGSHELEAARAAGMSPLQATWYLKEGFDQPCGPMANFDQAVTPMDVVEYCSRTALP